MSAALWRSAASSALLVSGLCAIGDVIGPSPQSLGLITIVSLFARRVGQAHSPRPAWRAPLGALLLLSLLFAPGFVASIAAGLGSSIGFVPENAAKVVLLLAWGGSLALSHPAETNDERRTWARLVAAAGGALSALALPTPLAVALALLALLGSRAPSGAEPRARSAGLSSLPAALLVGWMVGLATAHLRGALNPSLDGALAILGGLLLGARLGGTLSLGPGAGLVLSGLAAVGVFGGLGLAGPALPALDTWAVADSGPLDGRLLLTLPLLAIGLGGGLLLGLGAGLRPSRWEGVAVALGGLGGLEGERSLLPLSLAFTAALAFGAERRWLQVGGLITALTTLIGMRALGGPSDELLTVSRWRLLRGVGEAGVDRDIRARQRVAWSAAGAAGAAALRAPSTAWRADRLRVDQDSWPLTLEVEGQIVETTGRAAEAERMAGLLAGLLAPRFDEVLILGDDAGRALIGASAFQPGLTRITTPLPGLTRAQAALDAPFRTAALAPGVQLRPVHPELLLRTNQSQDAIIDVIRAPWRDALHATLDPEHLRAAHRALADDGVYVICLHLGWFAEGAPAAALGPLLDQFEVVQLWLPPTGADSLLVVASDRPLPLSRLFARHPAAAQPLRDLGFPSPLLLAGFALGDRESLASWTHIAPGFGPLTAARGLSQAVFRPPVQHLTALAERTATAEALWDLREGGAELQAQAAPLDARIAARGRYLKLLGDAARGDVQGVFAGAQALSQGSADASELRALEALIEPQMERAHAHLVAARAEGTGSRRWEDAAREATTARLLAPRSPAPPLVQGEIALAQGNLARARDAFEEVLRLDPKNRDALSGLARVARARKDNVEAERRLREATEAWPQDWSAWQNLGVFLSEIGEDDAAQAPLERALALSRGEHPEPALALTALFLARGEPTTALVHAERAVLQGGGAYAWYLRGRCWFDLDKLDQAEEDFRRAVLADPNLVEARGGIGQIRAMAGDLDQAAEAFRSVLAIDPNNGAARENLRRIDLARPAAPPPATAPGSSSDPG